MVPAQRPSYNAATGYDLASGLGSVDASVLLTNWGNVKFASTTTTLTPSSTSFTHGTSITVSGSVTPGTATGNVALMTDSTEPVQQGQGFAQVFKNASGTFALTATGTYTGPVNYLPGGTYNIWGQYSGDGTNAASTSQKTSITVNPENSGIYFNLFSPTAGTSSSGSITSGDSIDYGTQLLLSAQVAPSSQLTALENCVTNNTTCPAFTYSHRYGRFCRRRHRPSTPLFSMPRVTPNITRPSRSVRTPLPRATPETTATTIQPPPLVNFTVAERHAANRISAANQDAERYFITGQPTVFNIQVVNGAASQQCH